MQFGERIREAIREVRGVLITMLKIISEAQLRVVFPGAERSKQVVDFRPLELDILSSLLPPDQIPINLFELVIRHVPGLVLILKLSHFSLPV
jgi:hypothetical protein